LVAGIQVNVGVLHQNPPESSPMGTDFDYAKAFEQPRPRRPLMKDLARPDDATSQDWWPAD